MAEAHGSAWCRFATRRRSPRTAGKPNNLKQIEDYDHFLIVAGSAATATWNDLPNDPTQLQTVRARHQVAFVVEFDRKPLP